MSVQVNSEAYLAGALLIDGDKVIQSIRSIVNHDDFHVEAYGAIFSAALSLASENASVDPASIRNRASRNGFDLSFELINELMDSTPTAANCVEYAHRVAEDAQTRRIKELAIRIQEDSNSTPDELLATLQRESEAIRGSNYRKGLLTQAEMFRRFTDHVVNAGMGITTSFPRAILC